MYSKLQRTYPLNRSHQRNQNGGEYGGMNKRTIQSRDNTAVQQCMKQKKTEDEGGNNNTFKQSDKSVHSKVVHCKAENRR